MIEIGWAVRRRSGVSSLKVLRQSIVNDRHGVLSQKIKLFDLLTTFDDIGAVDRFLMQRRDDIQPGGRKVNRSRLAVKAAIDTQRFAETACLAIAFRTGVTAA